VADLKTHNPNPLRLVNLQERQRVRTSDFQQVEINARHTFGTLLVIMTNGATAKFGGGLIASQDGARVKVTKGVFMRSVDPPDSTTQFTAVSYGQLLSDVFMDRPPGAIGVTRDDLIVASPMSENDPQQQVQFLKADSLGNPLYDAQGRPVPETRSVAVSSTVKARVDWLQANSSNQVFVGPWSTPVGIVHLKADGSFTVENISYEPCTVGEHRSAAVLDHPPGSVKSHHLDPNIVGPDYVPGQGLTLSEIAKEIVTARGTLPQLSDRLDLIVDENGNIIDESVRDAIEDLFIQFLGNLLDEKGNLSMDAVLRTGATSRFACLSGSVSGGSPNGLGGLMPVPDGFIEEECRFMVSPAYISFAIVPNTQITYDCYSEGRRAHCLVTVDTDDGNRPVFYGRANFMVIGIKNV